MRKLATTAIALLIPLTIACGDDNGTTDPPAGEGTFSATVSGSISESFSGVAYFGAATDPETGQSGWILWLSTTEDQTTGKTLYFLREGNRPGSGTFPLVDLDQFEGSGSIGAFFMDTSGNQIVAAMGSTGGSITITDSDSDRMSGSFNVQASGMLVVDGVPVEENITISGQFDATSGSVFHPGF